MNQPSSSHRAGSRLSPLAHSICALAVASLGASALAAEAVFSSGAFSGDADSGVSTAKTYVALGNIIGGNVTVNGTTFVGSGGGLSGTGWALTGVPNQFGSGGNHTATFGGSVIDDLFDGFQYNGSPGTLTLSGLTVGQTYVATLYNEAWGLGANRTQAVTSSEGAGIVYNEDEFEASTLRYTFVATGTTTALNFAPKQAGNTMHFYGVSNEQVFNNSWISGANASSSAWTVALPLGVGKNASFGAQGAPTNFDLDVAVTTGHVQFDGANAWTVTGANTLTLQADAGGTSVLSTLSGTHTISAAVQLNSPVAKFGAGTMRLTGAVAGSGKGVTIGAGTLAIESATADLSSVGNIANGGTLAITNAAAQKIEAVISGTGGLTKSGNGTFTLGGYQTYGGPTVINAGTLKLSSIDTLSIANPSFQTHDPLANGSFGYSPTGASWTFSGAGIALNGSPWFSPTNHDGDAGGFIQGTSISQSINVTNTGYYTFGFQGVSRGGGNGPTGLLFQVDGTTVKAFDPTEFSNATWQNYAASVSLAPGAHTIAFVANNLLGGDRSTVIDLVTGASGGRLPGNSAVSITASGATLDLSAATQTIGSLVGVAGTSVINDGSLTTGGSGFSGDFAGAISGGGSFTKAGGGAMTLSGANTYGGSTTVSGGTLRLTGGSLPTGTALSLTAAGATFDLNGSSVNAGSLSGVTGSAVTLGSGTLAAGSNNSTTTFAGVISGAGGSLVKNGNGTLTLGSTNGYTGATTVNGGAIFAGAAGAVGSGLLTVVTNANATLDLGASQTVTGLEGGGSMTLARAVSTAFSGDASSGISLSKTYTHLIDFNASGGATTVNGVAFTSAGTSGGNWTLTGAGVAFNGGGGSGIAKLLSDFYYNGNPGTLTLSGFAPGSLNEVRLYNRDFGPAGQRFQTATFNTGSTVDTLNNYDQNGIVGSNYLAYQFRADASGNVTVSMSPSNPGTYHWYGVSAETVANLATTLTLGDAGNHQFDGPVSGPGNIVKVGGGTQQLNGVNTYAGRTDLSAGILQLGSGKLPGPVTGIGALVKAGGGTLTLSGANNYSGGTTVSGGTLKTETANAAIAPMTVGGGATWDLGAVSHTITGLTGNGTIARSGVVSTGLDGSATISASKTYVQALAFNNGNLTVNGVNFTGTGPGGAGYSLSGVPNPFSGGPTPGGIGGGASYAALLQNFYYGGNPGVLSFTGLTNGETYEAVVFSNQAWGTRTENATFASGSGSQQLLATNPGNYGYYSYKFVADGSTATITMAPLVGSDTYHWYGATLADLGTSFPTLTVGDAGTYTFSGAITGPTALVKQGIGTQILGGASSYTGGTAISAGTLLAFHPAALGTGAVSIASGANYLPWWNTGSPVIANNFTLNGLGGFAPGGDKTAIYADGGGAGGFAEYTLAGSVTLAATGNLGGNANNNLRVAGPVTGPGGLTKGGGRIDEDNTLILANPANNYAGNTLIAKGTVKLAAAEVIPHGAGKGGVTVNLGATFDLGGFGETINSLAGAGTITSTASIGTPVYFNNDAGTGISVAKTYTHALDFAEGGNVTINGVAFTGAATSGATWSLTGTPGTAGNGATGATGDISTLLTNFFYGGNPANLTLTGLTPGVTYETHLYERQWGGDRTQLYTVSAGAGSGTMIFDEDASATPSYIPFRFTANGSGQAVITTNQIGAGSYHWYGLTNEVVAKPVLTVGDASSTAFSGSITGPLGLKKQGAGTLTLSGVSTYTGGTVISAGILNVNADPALGGPAGAVTIENNATLQAGGPVTVASRTITLGTGGGKIDTNGNTVTLDTGSTVTGTTLEKTGTGTLNLKGSQTYAALTTTAGTTNLYSALGTGTSTLTANATTNIYASQTLASLTIADGVEVTFGDGLPFAGGSDKFGGGAAVVPEPGSMALLLAGALGLAARRRRG